MELKLESSLAHQLVPVNAVATVVEASMKEQAKASHQNPVLATKLDATALEQVRREVGIYDKATKKRIHERNLPDKIQNLPHHSLLDIKMETGTGKTYVYTRTMFELHKRCRFNKFIVAVPTLPIKAGTAAFIDDAEVMRHFSKVCGYNAEIELCLLEPQKQKKKGRLNIPSAVGHFFYGSHHVKNKIYVMLLNTQLITNGKLLTREDYDQMLGEFHKPVDAIKDTLPVLIIDEPHRIDRESKSYGALIESFCPPSQEYMQKFQNRVLQCINKYNPDMLYFDDTVLPFYGASTNTNDQYSLNILQHYYNHSDYYFGASYEANYQLYKAYIFAANETLATTDIPAQSIAFDPIANAGNDNRRMTEKYPI